MDEAIEIIFTNGKIQKVHTIIVICVSSMNVIIIILFPYLTKKPSFQCAPVDEYNPTYSTCNESLFCDVEEFDYKINMQNTLNNWGLQFSLYCHRETIISILYLSYFIGGIVSSCFFTYIGDKYGRMKLYKYLSLLNVICYFLFMICFNVYLLIAICFCFGISSFGYIMSSLIVAEYLTRSKAAWYNSLNTSSGFILAIVLGQILIYSNNFFLVFLILFLFSITCCYYTYTFFTESPSWFVSHNRINECFDMLKAIAIANGRENDYEQINKESYGSDNIKVITSTDFIWDIYKYNSQKKRLIIHFTIWFLSSLSFYGVEFNLWEVEDHFNIKLLMYFIGAIISQISIGVISDIYGRKKCSLYSFYLSGISCFIYTLVPSDNWIKIVSLIIILLGSSAGHSIMFIFTAEDFPTAIRCTVIGMMFLTSRIGAIVSFILVRKFVNPFLIFAIASCIAGRISEVLEETYNLILDDDVPENKVELPFKKKKSRALINESRSGCSEIYFLTSDDESFNKGLIYY